MNAKQRPEWAAAAVAPPSSTEGHSTARGARREALQRMHSVRVVAEAIDAGTWEVEFGVVDALAHLVDAAARDLLVAELEVFA